MNWGTALSSVGLMKRSADNALQMESDRQFLDEQRDWERQNQEQQRELSGMQTEVARGQMEDLRRRRATDEAVRAEASKGFGLTPRVGQRSGDWSDVGVKEYEGRTESNMLHAMAQQAQSQGDYERATQLRQQADAAEASGARKFVQAYLFDGLRGRALGEIWNSSRNNPNERIDPDSIQDDGEGNITFRKLDGSPGKPINMGQLAMLYKMLNPTEWDLKDNKLFEKKAYGRPRVIDLGGNMPTGKDRYMTVKQGDNEVVWDTVMQQPHLVGAGGADGAANADWYKKHLPEINAISEAVGARAPIDPASGKPVWSPELQQRNEWAQRIYRRALEEGRQMSPQQAANLALTGKLVRTPDGRVAVVATTAGGGQEQHLLSADPTAEATSMSAPPTPEIPAAAQAEAQKMGGTAVWGIGKDGKPGVFVQKDGKWVAQWVPEAGAAEPPTPPAAPPGTPPGSARQPTTKALSPQEELAKIEAALKADDALRKDGEVKAWVRGAMSGDRSQIPLSYGERKRLEARRDELRRTKPTAGDVRRVDQGMASGGKVGLKVRGYADGGRVKGFDPEGSDYDYETARGAGLEPDETGHWPSREPRSGMLLKGRKHPTWALTEKGEAEAGHEIAKGKDGRYYSQKRNLPTADTEAMRQELSPAVKATAPLRRGHQWVVDNVLKPISDAGAPARAKLEDMNNDYSTWNKLRAKAGLPPYEPAKEPASRKAKKGYADGGAVGRGAPSAAQMAGWPKKPLRTGTGGTVSGASVRDFGLAPRTMIKVIEVPKLIEVPAKLTSQDVFNHAEGESGAGSDGQSVQDARGKPVSVGMRTGLQARGTRLPGEVRGAVVAMPGDMRIWSERDGLETTQAPPIVSAGETEMVEGPQPQERGYDLGYGIGGDTPWHLMGQRDINRLPAVMERREAAHRDTIEQEMLARSRDDQDRYLQQMQPEMRGAYGMRNGGRVGLRRRA